MRLVDVVLNARYPDKHPVLLEMFVGKPYVPSELYFSADVYPILFRPNSVKFARKREFLFLVVKEIFHGGTEHIPRSTRLCLVVTDIGIGHTTFEHDIGVCRLRRKRGVRHRLPVYLRRDYLETPCRLSLFGVMVVFDLKLTPGEHTRLKDYCHRFALDKTFLVVERVGYGVIHYIIEVVGGIFHNDACNLSYAFRVNVRAVQAVLCKR